jgi:DNA-binding FadR family transcriptional regulator
VIHETGDDTTPQQLRRRRLAVHQAIVEAIETQDEKALNIALRRHSTYRYKH